MTDITIEGSGWRIDQAEILTAITALGSARVRRRNFGLTLSPSCSEVPALATTTSPSLSPSRISTLSSDSKPDRHAAHLDGAVAHHPHAGAAFDAVIDGIARNGDAATAAGVDGGAGKHADPKRGSLPSASRTLPSCVFLSISGATSRTLPTRSAPARNRHPRDLAGLELGDMDARNLRFELDLVVDQDLKQRLGLRRSHLAQPRRALHDQARGRRLQRDVGRGLALLLLLLLLLPPPPDWLSCFVSRASTCPELTWSPSAALTSVIL